MGTSILGLWSTHLLKFVCNLVYEPEETAIPTHRMLYIHIENVPGAT